MMRSDDEVVQPKAPPRIDLTCPECGHVQSEPVRVVSTQCRNCLSHYQVQDGRVVARPRPQIRLAKPGAHDDSPAEEPAPPSSPPPTAPRKATPPPMPWWKRLIMRPGPPRQAHCFACQREFTAGAGVESTQCPGCGGYVSLRHYDINESWTRPLQTCGDVVLQKEGTIHRTRIQCHDFTSFGKIAGDVESFGELVIHNSGKITGSIRCRQLRVSRKARVDFLEPVQADDVLIEGEVRGVLDCSGTVTLARRSLLQGLVRAAHLQVRPGGRHVGTFDPIAPDPSGGQSLADVPSDD